MNDWEKWRERVRDIRHDDDDDDMHLLCKIYIINVSVLSVTFITGENGIGNSNLIRDDDCVSLRLGKT